ncbi:hypothetical protein [Streptomyces iakyrus]|uniref:hypothetical protein n=1 Tax=Streptomyces iakyrus TaxID=68219 RepID=UPI0033F8686C
MRNGEAYAVNLNDIVADDVYRITEQVNRTTSQYERLKHCKVGERRDVPCPRGTSTGITYAQSAQAADTIGRDSRGYEAGEQRAVRDLVGAARSGRPKDRPGRRGLRGSWPFGRGGRGVRATKVVSVPIPTWRSA